MSQNSPLQKSNNGQDRYVPYVAAGSGDPIKPVNQTYTITNDTTARTLDANGGDIAVVSDVLATLIRDLVTAGIIKIA